MSPSNPQSRPILSVAIGPKSPQDRAAFQRALSDLVEQDKSVQIECAEFGEQIRLKGMDESHLEACCEFISRQRGIEIELGEPAVIYLEAIRTGAEGEGKYIRQTGGRGNYGHVKLWLEPLQSGKGYEFVNRATRDAVPLQFIEPIDHGIQAAMKAGILSAKEMVDVRAILLDGSYHAEDSNEMAFRFAASMAFKEAARKAAPILLEPVMSVEAVVAT